LPLQVVNGPRYELALHGTGYRPRLRLSFQSHNFGPVHVWRPGMAPAVAVLVARNDDEQPVSFEVMYGEKEHLAVSSLGTPLPAIWLGGLRSWAKGLAGAGSWGNLSRYHGLRLGE
jgi:hypothetical protein